MATSKKAGRRPTRSAVETEQKALDAHALAVAHRARIEDRLPEGAIDALAEDLGAIGVIVPGALKARLERRGATESQTEAAAHAKDLVMGIRRSLATAGLSKATRAEYGEGSRLAPEVVKSVVGAGEQILSRAAAHPEEVRAAGILERDLVALREAIDAAIAADRTQESRKKAQRDATAARNATLVRIEAIVKRISSAGQLEFVGEPETRRKFEALVAPVAKTKKSDASSPA